MKAYGEQCAAILRALGDGEVHTNLAIASATGLSAREVAEAMYRLVRSAKVEKLVRGVVRIAREGKTWAAKKVTAEGEFRAQRAIVAEALSRTCDSTLAEIVAKTGWPLKRVRVELSRAVLAGLATRAGRGLYRRGTGVKDSRSPGNAGVDRRGREGRTTQAKGSARKVWTWGRSVAILRALAEGPKEVSALGVATGLSYDALTDGLDYLVRGRRIGRLGRGVYSITPKGLGWLGANTSEDGSRVTMVSRVLKALSPDRDRSVAELCTELRSSEGVVRTVLSKLIAENLVSRPGRGRYRRWTRPEAHAPNILQEGPTRLLAMLEAWGEARVLELALALGWTETRTGHALGRLRARGKVRRVRRGVYEACEPRGSTTTTKPRRTA